MASITWTGVVNCSNVGGVITKTAGANDTPNAGAVSTEALTGDGSFELTIDQLGEINFGLDPSSTLELVPANTQWMFELNGAGNSNFREDNVYQGADSYAAGQVLKFERVGTTVKLYINGVLKDTSGVTSTGNVYAHVVILDQGLHVSNGQVTGSGGGIVATLPTTSAITQTTAPTSYPNCITHKNAIPVPAGTFVPPAKGDKYLDAAFNQWVIRGTDGNTGTLPARLNRSHRMMSSAPICVWSRDGTQIINTTPSGAIELSSVNRSYDDATRGRMTFIRDVNFTGEPTFSRVTAGKIFGMVSWKLQEYDTTANTYTTLMDLEVVDAAYTVAGKNMGGTVHSSMSSPERIACFYGGNSQDLHFRVMAFDRNNLGTRVILDTQAGTINGVAIPGGAWNQILVHSIGIDLSGQYVLIFSTQQAGDPICVIWDTINGSVGYITTSDRPYGHNAHAWKVNINNESVGDSPYFAYQAQVRNLATPQTFSKVFATSVGQMGAADTHYGGENGRSDVTTPLLVDTYKYYEDIPENLNFVLPRTNTLPWGPLDREIYWMDYTNGNVYRVCHNRSNTYSDDGTGSSGFWYQPMAHPDPQGRFIAHSSNMEKTLGLDAANEAPTLYRSDIFIVDMEWTVTEEGSPANPAARWTRRGKALR